MRTNENPMQQCKHSRTRSRSPLIEMLRLKNRGKYMGSRKHTLIATTAAGKVYFVGLLICLCYRSHLNCISQRIYVASVPAEKYQRPLPNSTTHEPSFELHPQALLVLFTSLPKNAPLRWRHRCVHPYFSSFNRGWPNNYLW